MPTHPEVIHDKKGKNMRIQVNLNENMVISIDKYAKLLGVSRSSLCAIWISQGEMDFEKYHCFDYEMESEET